MKKEIEIGQVWSYNCKEYTITDIDDTHIYFNKAFVGIDTLKSKENLDFEFYNQLHTLSEWCEILGISKSMAQSCEKDGRIPKKNILKRKYNALTTGRPKKDSVINKLKKDVNYKNEHCLKVLGVSQPTLNRFVKEDKLIKVKIGKERFIKRV